MAHIEGQRAATQPGKTRTAGSTFKKTPGQSASKLIDEAGFRVDGADMSEMHANFIINDNGATAHDIETLGEAVRARVFAARGIKLD